MKNFWVSFFIYLSLDNVIARTNEVAKIDFSSLDAYENVVKELISKGKIEDQTWANLIDSVGYRELFKREVDSQDFKNSLLKIHTKKLEIETKYKYHSHLSGWAFDHFKDFSNLRKNIQDEFVKVFENQKVLEQKIFRFFPKIDKPLKSPVFSILVFGPDARGYDPILIDISMAKFLTGEWFVNLLAHEAHHYYRDQITHFKKEGLNPIEQKIFWALNQVQAEGMADLINVAPFLEVTIENSMLRTMRDNYLAHFKKGAEQVVMLDKIISDYEKWPNEKLNQFEQEIYKAIPKSGHPTGLYMAKRILEKRSEEQLNAVLANPFQFFYLYQDVCKEILLHDKNRNDVVQFNSKSIEKLKILEVKVIK